jgi:Tfp pilus assembly protein PilF
MNSGRYQPFQFHSGHAVIMAVIGLVVATFIPYWQVRNHAFVLWDDYSLIVDNPPVASGLSWENIKWALTATQPEYWHPMTWLSHMLDCSLYGLNPKGHHLNNLLIHGVNTVLLFLVLRRMTGRFWRSFLVAALFSLHPLHVESVAWVSERKDVLSALFWLLSMWAYTHYVHRSSFSSFLVSLLFFAFGLMTKPMVVTLPFVLLLLDYWPLDRFRGGGKDRRHLISRVIMEKVPFLILSAMVSFMTIYVLQNRGSIASSAVIPVKARIANALFSYVDYMGKMLWPKDLACIYPYTSYSLISVKIIGSFLLLVSITFVVFRFRHRMPHMFTGWFWYLGTLVPVLGLIQVGAQAMSDRYTYIPLIGFFILIVWSVEKLIQHWSISRAIVSQFAILLLILLTMLTWSQVTTWRDSRTLFTHASAVTPGNFMAHFNLGNLLVDQGRFEDGYDHLLEARRIDPGNVAVNNNLGSLCVKMGKYGEAVTHYSKALEIDPGQPKVHNNLGNVLAKLGRFEEAVGHYSEALRLSPRFKEARYNLTFILKKMSGSDGET